MKSSTLSKILTPTNWLFNIENIKRVYPISVITWIITLLVFISPIIFFINFFEEFLFDKGDLFNLISLKDLFNPILYETGIVIVFYVNVLLLYKCYFDMKELKTSLKENIILVFNYFKKELHEIIFFVFKISLYLLFFIIFIISIEDKIYDLFSNYFGANLNKEVVFTIIFSSWYLFTLIYFVYSIASFFKDKYNINSFGQKFFLKVIFNFDVMPGLIIVFSLISLMNAFFPFVLGFLFILFWLSLFKFFIFSNKIQS